MSDKKKKEPFEFRYTYPSLDWYGVKNVVINDGDYYYFTIERRYGPSWWLIGKNPPKDKNKTEWSSEQLGEIEEPDLKRFIEWAKEDRGSRITDIHSISGDFNIVEDIARLIKREEDKR